MLDNAPAHSPNFENDLVDEFNFIYVKYLQLNSTPPIQPIDQQIIANFKTIYTKALFRKCFQVTTDTQFTLKELWKNHFNIRNCVNVIDNNARSQVSYRNINSAWPKLWLVWQKKTWRKLWNPASKVAQIRAALVPVPSPDKWGGLRQEGHPA